MKVRVRRVDNGKTYAVEAESLRWWINGDYKTARYSVTRSGQKMLRDDAPYMRLSPTSQWCARVVILGTQPARHEVVPDSTTALAKAFRLLRGGAA